MNDRHGIDTSKGRNEGAGGASSKQFELPGDVGFGWLGEVWYFVQEPSVRDVTVRTDEKKKNVL